MRPSLQTQGWQHCWPGEIPAELVSGLVIITATRAAEEPRRLVRLRSLTLAVLSQGPTTLWRLHDHKGRLSIDFRGPVKFSEIDRVLKCWKDEGEHVIEAVYSDGVLAL